MKEVYDLAAKDIGTWEWAGADHNPKVLAYFKDAGHAWVRDDETPWCAAFVGAILKRCGIEPSGELTARSYLHWGEKVPLSQAQVGDVVVFSRGNSPWQGHVGFFSKVTKNHIYVLGGNQANQVNIKRYSKDQLLGVRRWPEPKIETTLETPPTERGFSLIGFLLGLLRGGK